MAHKQVLILVLNLLLMASCGSHFEERFNYLERTCGISQASRVFRIEAPRKSRFRVHTETKTYAVTDQNCFAVDDDDWTNLVVLALDGPPSGRILSAEQLPQAAPGVVVPISLIPIPGDIQEWLRCGDSRELSTPNLKRLRVTTEGGTGKHQLFQKVKDELIPVETTVLGCVLANITVSPLIIVDDRGYFFEATDGVEKNLALDSVKLRPPLSEAEQCLNRGEEWEWAGSCRRASFLALCEHKANLRNEALLRTMDVLQKQWGSDCTTAFELLQNAEILNLSGMRLVNLSPLWEARKLKRLSLTNNRISDMSPLSELKGLSSIDVTSNFIEDFSILLNFSQLEDIVISCNRAKSIDFLGRLPQLRSLYASCNEIEHVTLNGFPVLEKLVLSDNNIHSFTAPQDSSLKYLTLAQNRLADTRFFSRMPRLEYLYLNDNQISEVTAPPQPNRLLTLDLRGNALADGLAGLQGLTRLREFRLEKARLDHLDSFPIMPALEILNLSQMDLRDLAFLTQVPNLKDLYLRSSVIHSLKGLQNQQTLESLYILESTVQDLPFIAGHPNLETIQISGATVPDLSWARDLPGLHQLYIVYSQLHDLADLANLTKLERLAFTGNRLESLHGIETLKELYFVALNDNAIKDFSLLAELPKLSDVSINHNFAKAQEITEATCPIERGATALRKVCQTERALFP